MSSSSSSDSVNPPSYSEATGAVDELENLKRKVAQLESELAHERAVGKRRRLNVQDVLVALSEHLGEDAVADVLVDKVPNNICITCFWWKNKCACHDDGCTRCGEKVLECICGEESDDEESTLKTIEDQEREESKGLIVDHPEEPVDEEDVMDVTDAKKKSKK
jgi:hypothetical protein